MASFPYEEMSKFWEDRLCLCLHPSDLHSTWVTAGFIHVYKAEVVTLLRPEPKSLRDCDHHFTRPPDILQGRNFFKQLKGKSNLRLNRRKMTWQDIRVVSRLLGLGKIYMPLAAFKNAANCTIFCLACKPILKVTSGSNSWVIPASCGMNWLALGISHCHCKFHLYFSFQNVVGMAFFHISPCLWVLALF